MLEEHTHDLRAIKATVAASEDIADPSRGIT